MQECHTDHLDKNNKKIVATLGCCLEKEAEE